MCEDYQIPRPPSSYWSALNYGKNPQKTPLPSIEKEGLIKTEDYVKPRRVKRDKLESAPLMKTPDGKYPPRELPPDTPVSIYTVPQKLISKDPVILDTKTKLRERNGRNDNPWSEKNPYKSTPEKWLDITVSEKEENRALRVFYTVLRAAKAKGYQLKIDVDNNTYYPTCSTYIVVRNHEIRVELKEINHQVKTEDGTRGYYGTVGSGKLKFLCDKEQRSWRSDQRCAAQDTEYTHIEDKIERIIEVLGEIADERDRAEEERRQAEERRRQEEEQKRLEAEEKARIEARKEEERNKVRRLLLDADRVRVAAMIREYVAQYEVAMNDKMDEEELKKRLRWMREKADYFDPFVNKEDEWLTETDLGRLLNPEIIKTKEERRSSSYGYGHETEMSYWQIKNAWWNRR